MDQENPVKADDADQSTAKTASGRIVWIDIARALALVAMAIYHFAWDLQNFGYIEAPTVDVGGWKLFARADASSFLFLVGVSLVLANHPVIRWGSFWKRFAMIAAAAAAITVVTYFVTPRDFIFFGILHSIAVASLIGLLFLRVPPAITILAAVFTFLAPWYLKAPLFDHPVLWFIGLSDRLRPSNDYVPLLPWLTPVLLGIAAARVLKAKQGFDWLRRHAPHGRIASTLALGGRHSLAFYLLHQPILFGLVFLASQVAPAARPDPVTSYLQSCQSHCVSSRSSGFCERFCRCTVDGLLGEGLFNQTLEGDIDVKSDPRIVSLADQCTRQADEPQ